LYSKADWKIPFKSAGVSNVKIYIVTYSICGYILEL